MESLPLEVFEQRLDVALSAIVCLTRWPWPQVGLSDPRGVFHPK